MTIDVILYDLDDTPHAIDAEVFAIDLRRGRYRELDTIGPGGGSIYCHNLARNFDQWGASSGAYGAVVIGRKVVVQDTGVTVFTGFVEDIEYTWERGPRASAMLLVQDQLAAFGRTTYKAAESFDTEGELVPELRVYNQRAGARIAAMLARPEVDYPGPTSLANGTVPLDSDRISTGANVLKDLQLITKSEWGRLFIDRLGVLTLQDRYEVFGATPVLSFSGDGAGGTVPMAGVQVVYGSEHLFFSVSVTRQGGLTMTHTNTAAAAANPNLGARHLSIPNLLFAADPYSNSLAAWLASRYSQHRSIISGMNIRLRRLSAGMRADVLELDIGSVVDFDWTPNLVGDPVTGELVVEGVAYTANRVDGEILSLQLSDAEAPEFFTLDVDTLDGGKVWGF